MIISFTRGKSGRISRKMRKKVDHMYPGKKNVDLENKENRFFDLTGNNFALKM